MISRFFSSLDYLHPIADNTHIWLLDVSTINEEMQAHALNLLSSEELKRAASFSYRQSSYIVSRVFLREILAQYCKCSSDSLVFDVGPQGKPCLTNVPYPVSFNLSHSGNFIVLAINATARVGIDIEISRKRQFMRIAEDYFHAQEVMQLKSCANEQEQAAVFLQLWTLKEAFLKARGDGISGGLDKIYFNVHPHPWKVHIADSLNEQAEDWQFFSTTLSKDIYLSVAVSQKSPIKLLWFNGLDILARKFQIIR